MTTTKPQIKKRIEEYLNNMIDHECEIKLATGEICLAVLHGEKGGDLFNGVVWFNNKLYDLGSENNNLPRECFPIKSIGKTPFCDLDEVKK